jgi:hypothetical protein
LGDGKDENEIEEQLDEADAVMAVARFDAEEPSVVGHGDSGILHAPGDETRITRIGSGEPIGFLVMRHVSSHPDKIRVIRVIRVFSS